MPVIAFMVASMMILAPLAAFAENIDSNGNGSGEELENGGLLENTNDTDDDESEVVFMLTLIAAPPDGGEIDNGGEYEEGEVVTVRADAYEEFTFVNWTKNGLEISTNPSYNYTMPGEDVTLVANFEKVEEAEEVIDEEETGEEENGLGLMAVLYELNLAVYPPDSGTVSGGGNYEEGESRSISASPNQFYSFINWTAPAGSFADETALDTTFTMPDEDVTVTANFDSDYTDKKDWDGKRGKDSEDCGKAGEGGRPDDGSGWIHWVFATKGPSTSAKLVLGGSGSGTYDSTEGTEGGAAVWHFYTPYYDVETLTATIYLFGGGAGSGGGLVISDYCPGGDPDTYSFSLTNKS